MRILVTGGTGQVGRFITAALTGAGHDVTLLGRRPPPEGIFSAATGFIPWTLETESPVLPQADILIHAALDHEPGAYRGGEGDDPDRFWRLNHTGSLVLFDAAIAAGIPRIVFLSSRAVYGDQRRGETLRETDEPAPGSLYGQVKLATERALLGRVSDRTSAVILRPTGIYGMVPGTGHHKWETLFADFRSGATILPRAATEVHGHDLAAALLLTMGLPAAGPGGGIFNVSDLLLDRHDLLSMVRDRAACRYTPPARFTGPPPGIMDTGRLETLGWHPGSMQALQTFLARVFPANAAAPLL